MKKSFARLSIKLAILFFSLPVFSAGQVYASAHSVDFTANTVLSGAWNDFATVSVMSGSRAVSLVVNAGTIVVNVPSNHTFTLSTPNNINFVNTLGTPTGCGGTKTLTLSGTGGAVTITPTNTQCGGGSSGGSRAASSGGGGGSSGAQCVAPKAAVITHGLGGKNPDGTYSAAFEWDNPEGTVSTNREYEVFRGGEGVMSFDEMIKLEKIPGTNRRYTDTTNTLRPYTYSYGLRVLESTASGCAKQSKDSAIFGVRISLGALAAPVAVAPAPELTPVEEPEITVEPETVQKEEKPSLRKKVEERKTKRTTPNPHDVLSRSEFLEIVAEASSREDIIEKYRQTRNTRPTVTRAEALKILFDAFGVKVPRRVTKTSFKDVKANTWYAPYVETAKEMGLLESRTFRFRFSPSLKVKRGILDEMLQSLPQS